MPIYEYSCRSCEQSFEALVDNGETVMCPKCLRTELEQLLSVPARPLNTAPSANACPADAGAPPCGPMCARRTN
jgi:putative FmdB family regulatory protein